MTHVSAPQALIRVLPLLFLLAGPAQAADWLVTPDRTPARITDNSETGELTLENGLIRRVIRLTPGAATVALDNLMTGESVLRAVSPEARVTIDGTTIAVGGLTGQPDPAWIQPEWLDAMRPAPDALPFIGWKPAAVSPPVEWNRARPAPDVPWPPPGAAAVLTFGADEGPMSGLRIHVHYEIHEGLPLLAKWLRIENGTGREIRIDGFDSEILAFVEAESVVDTRGPGEWRKPLFHVQSDYAFRGMDVRTADRTTNWLPDPAFGTQVNYNKLTPALMIARPPIGPGVSLPDGGEFVTFRNYVLLFDGDDRERQGLAIRRMHRALAPWAMENPLMMHVRRSDRKTFRAAVDQCAEAGFEMIIYTFGSGLNMESDDPAYIDAIREDVEYAHGRGIEVGAYSLLASRRISDEHDVINPETGKTGGANFGNSPCLGSAWGLDYFDKLKSFIERTGLDLLEHDGSYPGDVCASTSHPGHRGLEDSQWTQWRQITDFYKWCRARGMYLNVPDYYFLAGSNKTGMGYRETNWSLPREMQIIHGRQNIYDGTWEKTPSMGWMFVPLVEYHGGGAAATLEPLSEHIDAYRAHITNNLASGVQACYRGPRLFDTPAVRDMVSERVVWFRENRAILESDIIHVRRADGRRLDCMMHVNPALDTRGLVSVWNPSGEDRSETLKIPLYYTGLETEAVITNGATGERARHTLARDYSVELPVEVPALGFAWFTVREN